MANAPVDTASAVVPVTGDAPVIIRPEVIAAYTAMIEQVPEAGQDGFDGILASIAQAKGIHDLDAAWRSTGLEALRNRTIRVLGIRRMPSDYPGGLPWFLVIDAADVLTGETVAITTGAVSVVAQLVKAHQLDAFPMDVIPRVAERPSRSGYFPVHLEIVS